MDGALAQNAISTLEVPPLRGLFALVEVQDAAVALTGDSTA